MKAYNVLSGLAVLMLVAYLLIYLRMGSILKRNHPKLWEELGPPIIKTIPEAWFNNLSLQRGTRPRFGVHELR
jgi:hypothetical protein